MEKMYLHPILKNKAITKEEYFEVLNSKAYDVYLEDFNEPLK
jgi:hypothetical protein